MGFHNGQFVFEDKLRSAFTNVGEILNLKENDVFINQNQENVPVSYFTKVYNFRETPDEKLDKRNDMPSMQSSTYHFNQLEYMEKPYYVLNTTEMFPYDAESIDQKNFKKNIEEVLRPEFVYNYSQPLKADTLRDYQGL